MDRRPIHQNLDTSYVNLSSLVKYLQRRQFAGRIKIRLNGYNAEILISESKRLKVREHDQISGRISEGPEAFQRLLIRAREPGGTIDVYQLLKKKAPAARPKPVESRIPVKEENLFVPIEIMEASGPEKTKLAAKNGSAGNNRNGVPVIRTNGYSKGIPKETEKTKEAKIERQTSLPDFPFDLTNSVERKAQRNDLSTADWQILLKLTVEILGVVDRSLSVQELDFGAAFRKARTEISDDYPFMNPAVGVFDYQKGKIMMTERVTYTLFVASIIESLKRIFERLGNNPRFDTLYRDTAHLIIALINKRQTHYDRFGITPSLKRILGI